jgi:outer membrane protein assembly factor BamB
MIVATLAVLNAAAQDAIQHQASLPPAGGVDWPCWRGPNHDGIAPSSPKLLDSWPKEGPKLLWKSPYIPSGAANGWASCVVADGKVFAYFLAETPKDPAKGFRPFTAEILAEWGWREDVPADLVAKIEDEWKSETWKQVQRGNKKVAMEEYAKKFAAGLDPKVAEKYADFINLRLNNLDAHGQPSESGWSWGGNYGWKALEQFAKLKDKEFKSAKEFTLVVEKIEAAHAFYQWGKPLGDAFGRVSKSSDTVACLDANTGKELWRSALDCPEGYKSHGGYCIGSTPAAANGKVYVSGQYWLYCLSAKDGAVVWKKDLKNFSHSSPLVLNGMLICCADGPLSAYDGETGKLLWQQHKAGGGNSSPVLWTHDGKTCIIFAGYNPCCIDPANGAIVWQEEKYHGADSTPVVSGDYLLVGQHEKRLFKLTPQKMEFLWNKGGLGGDHVGSALVYQDQIYDSGYSGGRCLDLKTGEVKWSEKENFNCGYGCPCIVDGKVIAYPSNIHGGKGFGYITMFRPTAEKFEMLGAFKPKFEPYIVAGDFAHIIDLNYITSLSVANGKLYVRMSEYVSCYDLTAAGNQ